LDTDGLVSHVDPVQERLRQMLSTHQSEVKCLKRHLQAVKQSLREAGNAGTFRQQQLPADAWRHL